MLYWFPLNPSKSKYQVVHEQKFKDLLSSNFSKIGTKVEDKNVLTDPEAGLTGKTDHFRVGSYYSYYGNRVESSWKQTREHGLLVVAFVYFSGEK